MAARFMTPKEAAEQLGISAIRVRHLLKAGRIKSAELEGGRWRIPVPLEITPGARGPGGIEEQLRQARQNQDPAKREYVESLAVWENARAALIEPQDQFFPIQVVLPGQPKRSGRPLTKQWLKEIQRAEGDERAAFERHRKARDVLVRQSMVRLVDVLRKLGCPEAVLKHARHPVQLKARRRLRRVFGRVGQGSRWEWPEADPQLTTVRRLLRDLC